MTTPILPSLRSGRCRYILAASAMLVSAAAAQGEVKLTTAHDAEGQPSFRLADVPAPARKDAGATATFALLDGRPDGNSGGLNVLNDGQVPDDSDAPGQNFFFAAGTRGGRILADLQRVAEITQINTYSWHPTTRGPQVYTLFASDGASPGFDSRPARSAELEKNGWKKIAQIDTRSKGGGQHAVSISDPDGIIGKYRYLLFDVAATETDDAFGNTFYSELDIVERNGTVDPVVTSDPIVLRSADDYCQITIDTAAAPELREWAEERLAPVLAEWYPRIVAMLPSEGHEAPKQFSVTLRPADGVAYAAGTRITANSRWISRELEGEAIGALVHEVVHVVQQYWGRRNNPNASRSPGWLVEGIPDYIRFFLFEPHIHGADILWLKARPNINLSYDARYRVTANFLNYAVENHDPEKKLIARLNAACREGRYNDDLWKEFTGKTLSELNDAWKAAVQFQLAAETRVNTLTEAEAAAGWKLLFNGKDTTGWRNFKRDDIRAGWQIQDGVLACIDPKNAGDLVTTEKFGAFELELEYNISVAGNSGILYHVTDEGGAVWATGPEFQLEDNEKASDPWRCGWLYGLYRPPMDPRNGKPIDATLPAGKWNHVRLVVSPARCEHFINGVKYFEYAIDSDDFRARVAASKFSRMPLFAKSASGYIALQGDHGQVSFRNIKIRPLGSNGAPLQTHAVK